MKIKGSKDHLGMANNAIPGVKCKQCGNMVGVTEPVKGSAFTCPVCGLSLDSKAALKSEISNEGY